MKACLDRVCWLMVISLCVGCQSERMALQGISFRDAVMDIYTDQILNNLIRAKNDQLFVQLRLTHLTVEEDDTASLGGSFGDTTSDTRNLAMAAASTATHNRNVVGTFSISPRIERKGTLSFDADPLVDRDDIYEAIIAFAKNEETFRSQCDPPPPEDVHQGTQRYYRGQYYWVPSTASNAFMKLAISASFGGPQVVKGYYEVTIKEVLIDKRIPFFVFNVAVPNDDGSIVISTPGTTKFESVELYALDPSMGGIKPGEKTTKLVAALIPPLPTLEELQKKFKDKSGRIYLSTYHPEAPTNELKENIDNIRGNINLLRIRQR